MFIKIILMAPSSSVFWCMAWLSNWVKYGLV